MANDNPLQRQIEVGTAVAIAVLGADSFHKYLPPVADIRKAKPGDKSMAADVHAGELLAGLTIFTVSSLAASVAGNGTPLVIGGVSFLAMIGVYEWLLRSPDPMGG